MFIIEPIDDETVKKVETFGIRNFVKISLEDDPKKFCIMTQKFVDQDLERIKNMEIFPDDIWVVTYPKCGTTWTQEMIWMLGNNLDYEGSMEKKLDERFPFLELSGLTTYPMDTFEMARSMSRPRYIKSHLPLFLLPDQLWTVKPKIVYVARNPKDAAVSFYHHHCNMHGYQGNKKDYIDCFVQDLFIYSPMNDHIIDFWNIRNQPNILFLFFEDMKRNLDQEVKKAIKFMEKDLSQKEIDKLCKHLSFESIRNNKSVNKEEILIKIMEMTGKTYDSEKNAFIRKGQVGGYKKELTQEENEKLDDYIKKAEFDIEYKF